MLIHDAPARLSEARRPRQAKRRGRPYDFFFYMCNFVLELGAEFIAALDWAQDVYGESTEWRWCEFARLTDPFPAAYICKLPPHQNFVLYP